MTLLSQTPWTTSDDPSFNVVVVATNAAGNERFPDLQLALEIGSAFHSRDQYENSLVEAPGGQTVATAPFKGALDPSEARTFRLDLDVSTITAIGQEENLVYPATVELRSAGAAIASISTSVIHLSTPPVRPMLFTAWAELSAPLAFDTQDRLSDPAFEESITPGHSLATEVQAIRSVASTPATNAPLDLVIQPSLVEQATRMAAGYTRADADGTQVAEGEGGALTAATFLQTLKDTVALRGVQLSAMPFSAPELPAMLRSDLANDLSDQSSLGNRWLRDGLGVAPSALVARPPNGTMDDASLEWLADHGVTTVLADADTVERPPQPNGFAPPPVATVETPDGTVVSLVLPDPGAQNLLGRADLLADPVRAAQAVLSELAVIWKEQPLPAPQPDGTDTIRGVSLSLPPTLPAGVWEPLLSRLMGAPFLEPVHAQDLAAGVNPRGERADLQVPNESAFSPTYADTIRNLHRDVFAYRSMLSEPSPVADHLERNLYYAESNQYLGSENEPAGQLWLDSVAATTGDAFARVTPTSQPQFTFTSQEGTIPLRMGDPGDVPLTVEIELQSAQFEFPDGSQQTVTLTRPNQIVSFNVVAKASGPNPIQVLVRAPAGQVISAENLSVRSTAVNKFALLITGGAALALVLLWLRRLMRRHKT
jgi:hypothetical protein